MMNPEISPPGHGSAAVRALRDEIARLERQRDELNERIGNAQRALSQLLSSSGESFHQLIDMAKVRMLRIGEQTYDELREYIRATGGVVIKGDLDHRLRQSLSRATAAGTVTLRGDHYELSRKERDRLRRLYPDRKE